MKDYNAIKNPLTIIAVFSGITEISGTIVLPQIAEKNQEIYIWFLMLFPTILVIIFFLTLNWNHKVLYAPSDFKDDKNFLSILQKSSTIERIEDIKSEMNLIENELENEIDNEEINLNTISKLDEEKNITFYKRAEYENDSRIIKELSRKRIINIKKTESFIFSKLENEYSSNIQRNLKFTTNRTTLLLDGVIENETSFICFEFLYMPSLRTLNLDKFDGLVNKFENLFEYLNKLNSKNCVLKIVCATYLDKNEAENAIRNRIQKFEVNYEILIFDIDKLHYT